MKTVAAGGPTNVTVTATDGGTRIRLSGTIAAGAAPLLRTSPVTDPAAFGRTALIEALARAGVEVTSPRRDPTRPPGCRATTTGGRGWPRTPHRRTSSTPS